MFSLQYSTDQFVFNSNSTMRITCLHRALIFVVFSFLLCTGRAEVKNGNGNGNGNARAEFAEPIKNISTSSGTNVEFSCVVRNLDNHRVMWTRREGQRDVLVAINSLKVSKNPRMTVSVMQSSGDVTRSTLYIYNVEKGDSGDYECSVSFDPPISQVGTLDVTASTGSNGEEVTSSDIERTTARPIVRMCSKDITNDCTIDINKEDESDNVFCIDLGQLWEKARLKVDKMLTSMYTFFAKITE